MTARLTRITGTLAEARPLREAALYELVRVGPRGLLAEIIRFAGDTATLQVFEDTAGLDVGAPVIATGASLVAELGPGLLGAVLDGVGRPLAQLAAAHGDFVVPGAIAPTLDRARRWPFVASARPGRPVTPGDVLGTVEERPGFEHRILVPPGITGMLAALADGEYTVDEPIGKLADGTQVALAHRWPLRAPRPVAQRVGADRPLVTGQRIFDLLFPLAEGGAIAVPGGFGTGKTIVEHSLAKYADADVVVFVGCGERGNEMAEVLQEFSRLVDPRTGRSVMDRTVLVVNTSNMPVVAREGSVYLGLTIAEYYRDMGYRVAVMVDSLSRWAEALRDIAARLQEMPGEEGYPTSMSSRLGAMYERAGRATVLGTPERTGSVTLVCAVSPPGGDFSEPVTQASLRVAGGLWALDAQLARARQFPAVDWATSYSLYVDAVAPALAAATTAAWSTLRTRVLALLRREADLREMASLLGAEEMEDRDRLVLSIRTLSGVGAPLDDLPPPIGETTRPVYGPPMNPTRRVPPEDFIETGLSAIDGLDTLVRGQKLPVFSGSGLPGLELAAQIVEHARVATGEPFDVVFAGIGITARETRAFVDRFRGARALEHCTLYLNETRDPTIEQLLAPRYALAQAEYLAFEHDMHVLVVMADIAHYCETLRLVAAAREEIPGRRGYPGYTYTDLASLFERSGLLAGRGGSVTQLPIVTMPDDDITHPIPDLTGYITEGQIVLSRALHGQGIYPPIDVLPSLSRLMNAGIGAGKTVPEHRRWADQLYALYARGRDARLMASIVGEASLGDTDRRARDFATQFEHELVQQGRDRRSLAETIAIGWRLLERLPREELERIDDETWSRRSGASS